MKTLRVNLGARSYPIIVGADNLGQAGCMLAGLGFRMAPIVASNSAVLRLHGPALLRSLEQSFGPVPVIRIGDGKQFKNHDTLLKIYDGLFHAKADRRSWLLVFWGRRGWRHNRLRCRHISGRHPLCKCADHSAFAGGQCHRREGRLCRDRRVEQSQSMEEGRLRRYLDYSSNRR